MGQAKKQFRVYRKDTVMIIEFKPNISIEIPTDICKELLQYRQNAMMNESGGILLGKKQNGSNKYEITRVTTPSKDDFSTCCSFIRNKKKAQTILNEEWQKSKGVVNYLGEWHTHSVPNPRPSYVDKLFIRQLQNDKTNQFKHFFMFILGNTGNLYIAIVDSHQRGKIVCEKLVEVE